MRNDEPDYSKMSSEELLDCWQWIDDKAYPDRAIELYQRVYVELKSGTEATDGEDPVSSFFGLLLGSSRVGRFALDMELDRLEAELRLKKARVEKLIAERQSEGTD